MKHSYECLATLSVFNTSSRIRVIVDSLKLEHNGCSESMFRSRKLHYNLNIDAEPKETRLGHHKFNRFQKLLSFYWWVL